MWLLRGYKSVGQFDAANPDVFLDPINFNVRAMAQITDTPLRMFDPQSSSQRSGVSFQEEDSPFISKIEDRQTVLRMRKPTPHSCSPAPPRHPEDPVVTVDWVPARSVTDAQGWQTVEAKIRAGVPRRQALMEAGYRAEQVDAWLTGTDDAELAAPRRCPRLPGRQCAEARRSPGPRRHHQRSGDRAHVRRDRRP
jgi:hypothetical protein